MFINVVCFKYNIILCFYLFSICRGFKRYDVEEESMKLYGTEFNTVLEKFRRTPEYLSILEEKISAMQQSYKDIGIQALSYNLNELQKDIENQLLSQKTNEDAETKEPPATTKDPENKVHVAAFIRRRDDFQQDQEEKKEYSLVEILDRYEKLYNPLTVAERNRFRALGFDYAGYTIKNIIKHESGDFPDDPTTQTEADLVINQTLNVSSGEEGAPTETTTNDQDKTQKSDEISTALRKGFHQQPKKPSRTTKLFTLKNKVH